MSKIMSKSCKKFPYWMFGTLFFLILLGLVFGIYNVREFYYSRISLRDITNCDKEQV